jgi:hypothetical protein
MNAEQKAVLARLGQGNPNANAYASDGAGTGTPVNSTSVDAGNTRVPASIRTNNPGAMWPGQSSAQFGSTTHQNVSGGNKIAVFDDPVNGAAAHFDLLSKHYAGMPLAAAIAKWSNASGNDLHGYIYQVAKDTGLAADQMLTQDLLRSPYGIAIAKSMAKYEAGRAYPMSDDQWQQAQSRAFGGKGGTQPQPNLGNGPAPQVGPQSAVTAGGRLAYGGPVMTDAGFSIPKGVAAQANGGTLQQPTQQTSGGATVPAGAIPSGNPTPGQPAPQMAAAGQMPGRTMQPGAAPGGGVPTPVQLAQAQGGRIPTPAEVANGTAHFAVDPRIGIYQIVYNLPYKQHTECAMF